MPEYKLNFCNTPQDYTRMFEVPCGSCMVLNDRGFGQAIWHKIKKEKLLYPSAWYHYTPHSKGVWLSRDDKPVARCMMYSASSEKDVWPLFGDVKAANAVWGSLLVEMMEEEGKKRIPCSYLARTTTSFVVPGIDSGMEDEGIICPLPHCDGQQKDFSVTFDAETREFTFWPDEDAPPDAYKVARTYDHDGYLRAEEVLTRECRKYVPAFNHLGW